nr:MAG TPA: hypothetical protein [Caudoviricetes sp.]
MIFCGNYQIYIAAFLISFQIFFITSLLLFYSSVLCGL